MRRAEVDCYSSDRSEAEASGALSFHAILHTRVVIVSSNLPHISPPLLMIGDFFWLQAKGTFDMAFGGTSRVESVDAIPNSMVAHLLSWAWGYRLLW